MIEWEFINILICELLFGPDNYRDWDLPFGIWAMLFGISLTF